MVDEAEFASMDTELDREEEWDYVQEDDLERYFNEDE